MTNARWLSAAVAIALFAPVSLSAVASDAVIKCAKPLADWDKKIEENAAKILEGGAPDKPSAVIHCIAFPEDASEYLSLGKHAVMLISARSADAADFPSASISVKTHGTKTQLEPIATKRHEETDESSASRMFGKQREDAFYLISVPALMDDLSWSVRFAHKDWGGGLKPADRFIPAFIRDDKTPDGPSDPKPKDVRRFVDSEFPDFLDSSSDAQRAKP